MRKYRNTHAGRDLAPVSQVFQASPSSPAGRSPHTPANDTYVHDPESLYSEIGQEQFLRAMLGMQLNSLSFNAFSQLVRKVLMHSGYSSVRSCGEGQDRKTSGEGGVDLLAFSHTDLSTSLTAIQLKMHRQPVPGRCVDELRGVKGRFKADALLMVSNAPFSAWAHRVASWPGEHPVQLIDAAKLCGMMLEKRLGVRVVPQGNGINVRTVFDAEFFAALQPPPNLKGLAANDPVNLAP